MREFDFYIVPTPIGNLGDITDRAVEVLKFVDIIACEDSRNTQKLLNHFSIDTKCISYHKFNEKERVNQFVSLIKSGKKIALVSDAGTPLFCDPGAVIVEELKKEGCTVTALPGANAVVTFISQIPRNSEEFAFVGFLPKSDKQITDLFNKYKNTDTTFYESPKRILATLKLIENNFPNRKVSIGRELTKVFEEVFTDTVDNVLKYLMQKDEIKGEFVVMLHKAEVKNSVEMFSDKIKILKDKNFSDKDVSVILSVLFGLNKNDVYDYLIKK